MEGLWVLEHYCFFCMLFESFPHLSWLNYCIRLGRSWILTSCKKPGHTGDEIFHAINKTRLFFNWWWLRLILNNLSINISEDQVPSSNYRGGQKCT